MDSSSRPPVSQTAQEPINMALLPKDKHDKGAIEHLASLGPAGWAPYILCGSSTPDMSARYPLDEYEKGLLCWLQDINWPIAQDICDLFKTLLNDRENRVAHGAVLIDKIQQLLTESDDWTWIAWTVGCVIQELEDREWVRSVFGDALRAMWARVPHNEEREWDFKEMVEDIVEEEVEDRFDNGESEEGSL